MPSLKAIPQSIWLGMAAFELLCGLALVAPAFSKSLGVMAPIAAACIAAEMLIFCVLHLRSSETNYSPIIYWLVVAAVCAFIAYGRFVLSPL